MLSNNINQHFKLHIRLLAVQWCILWQKVHRFPTKIQYLNVFYILQICIFLSLHFCSFPITKVSSSNNVKYCWLSDATSWVGEFTTFLCKDSLDRIKETQLSLLGCLDKLVRLIFVVRRFKSLVSFLSLIFSPKKGLKFFWIICVVVKNWQLI